LSELSVKPALQVRQVLPSMEQVEQLAMLLMQGRQDESDK
jgi:hypothetical protein